MFTIRSKVQNAVPTPIPSYNTNNRRRRRSFESRDNQNNDNNQLNLSRRSSTIKKKRRKKRRASEVVNINDYPSAKRRRISIIGVDVDPKKTKEIIQNKDFLLCEYHSNFPQFIMDEIKSLSKSQLATNIKMKSCDNQWIISKIITSTNHTHIIYWNTSLSRDNHNNIESNLNTEHHPNSPQKCYLIEIDETRIYDDKNDQINDAQIASIGDMEHIHLLYPSASSYSTLKPHRPFYGAISHQINNANASKKYNNPFMPYSLNKDILSESDKKRNQSLLESQQFNNINDIDLDIQTNDDSVPCPLFPSSTSRSITTISGVLFLSSDHRSLYVIPHDHAITVRHNVSVFNENNHNDPHQNNTNSNQFIYGDHKNVTYEIKLATNTREYNERVTYSQVLPQPRVGTHHTASTYKVLLGTSHGRLFYITIVLNKNQTMNHNQDSHGLLSKPQSDIYFAHGTGLGSKVDVRDHEILFSYSNDDDVDNDQDSNAVNGENVGWLGFVVSKIKLGATQLSQAANLDESQRQLQALKECGSKYDENLKISAICFGLNQNFTKVVAYTLRQHTIDCIEFTEKDYKLLWSFPLREIIGINDRTINMSLLGQGLSILTGFVDEQYGQALTVTLFRINTNTPNQGPLIVYGQFPVHLPPHIHVRDLSKLRYQSFWVYYIDSQNNNNDGVKSNLFAENKDKKKKKNKYRNDKQEMDEDDDDDDDDIPRLNGLDQRLPLQRQTSMADFVAQGNVERNGVIKSQHHLVAPFGMLWNSDNSQSQFIAVFPLLSTDKEDDRLLDILNPKCDEIWERLYGDYNGLYPGMKLNNSCGPDHEHFNNDLVTILEPNINNNESIPFYGGGCMLLPYNFEIDKQSHISSKEDDVLRSSEEEDDEKKIIEEKDDIETDDGSADEKIWKETRKLRRKIKQLFGGGYGYFMNDKYQIMRLKYSLSSAMARIHSDLEHYQKQQREQESKKIKTMIRLAFSEYRRGKEGEPRANRLSDKLIKEKDINILSEQICKISQSILNLKLFDTFANSNIIQKSIESIGFDTNKMRLGINQILIKLETYKDYINFLRNSPSNNNNDDIQVNNNYLWNFINNAQKCDIIQHREFLQIAHNLFNYFTNNQDENDHYGNRKQLDDDGEEMDEEEEDDDDDYYYSDDQEQETIMDLSNVGDSNHNMYREKYFALKQGFIPQLLRSVITERGDIEYILTYANDEYDTFFMRIAQMTGILTEIPKFLQLFLSHLTYEFYSRYIDGDKSQEINGNFEFKREIADLIKELAGTKNIHIGNEKDELVHQLIIIRIALEIIHCIINSANQYRLNNKELYNEYRKYNRTLWNYSSDIRQISIQICELVIPYLHKISPLLSISSSLNSSRDITVSTAAVIDTDNTYYDYILKKEKNEIYRNINELSRMIMQSFKTELRQNQMHKEHFMQFRHYLIKNLYQLFPIGKSVDRWKTDLVKDSVNKIAFEYGDCQYLVYLCDWNKIINDVDMMKANIHGNVNDIKQNIFNICIQRFIDNLIKYKQEFMNAYFKTHENEIEAFLCINIQKSDVWKSYKNGIDINKLLNQCISNYIQNSAQNHLNNDILCEYASLHNVAIDNFKTTAKQLYESYNNHQNNHNLIEQNINLSMAKLSVFVDGDDDDVDDEDDFKLSLNESNDVNFEDIENELIWINAKRLLKKYASYDDGDHHLNTFGNDKFLRNMSNREIVTRLIKLSLQSQNQNLSPHLQDIEEILNLINNLESISNADDLNDESLIIILIENIIDFNKTEWRNLELMFDPKQGAQDDITVIQILNRSAIYSVSKYLYDKRNQAQFLKRNDNDNDSEELSNHEDKLHENIIWDLWNSGMSFCSEKSKNEDDVTYRYYYAVRAFANAQMT